jgi:hypothetical protein
VEQALRQRVAVQAAAEQVPQQLVAEREEARELRRVPAVLAPPVRGMAAGNWPSPEVLELPAQPREPAETGTFA